MIKVSKREKYLALIGCMLCLLFAGRAFLADGFPGSSNATKDRIQVLTVRLRKARAELAQQPFLEKKLEVLGEILGRSTGEGPEISLMSSRVHALAKKTGVRILNIQPSPVTSEEYYLVYFLEVSFEGAWKVIAPFLNEIGSATDRVEIRSLRLEKYSDAFNELRGNMLISRIRLR